MEKIKEEEEIFSFQKVTESEFFYQTQNKAILQDDSSKLETFSFDDTITTVLKTESNMYIFCPNKGNGIYYSKRDNNNKFTQLKKLVKDDLPSEYKIDCYYNSTYNIIILSFKLHTTWFIIKESENDLQFAEDENVNVSESNNYLLASLVFTEEIKSLNKNSIFFAGFYYNDSDKSVKLCIRKKNKGENFPKENFLSEEIKINAIEGILSSTSVMSFYLHKYFFLVTYNSEEFHLNMITKNNNGTFSINNIEYFPVKLSEKYTIVKVEFFESDSRFLYYEIETESKNHYVGVFDALNFLIIFNCNVQTPNVAGVDKLKIVLSDKREFCPFSFDGKECGFCFNEPSFDVQVSDFFLCLGESDGSCKEKTFTHGTTFFYVNSNGDNKCTNANSYYSVNKEYFFRSTCPAGFTKNSTSGCQSCDKYKFENDDCKNKCGSLYYYKDKCLQSCPKGTFSENNQCKSCESSKFLLYNQDEKCVEESVCKGMFYAIYKKETGENYCERCKEKEFLSEAYQCISTCEQQVEENEEGIKRCVSCKSKGMFLYEGKCYKSCKDAEKGNVLYEDTENMICYSKGCSFECKNNGRCDTTTNSCICPEGYFGTFCNIAEKYPNATKEIEIYERFDGEDNCIIFSFSPKDKNSNLLQHKLNISWEASDMGHSINGNNEKIFKVSTKGLVEKDYNIELKIIDEETQKIYQGTFVYTYEVLDESRFNLLVSYDKEEPFYAMKSIIKISIEDTKVSSSFKNFEYYFYFVDEYNDNLLLTDNESTSSTYEGMLPYTTKIAVKILDKSGCQCFKYFSIPFEIHFTKEKPSIESIIGDKKSLTIKFLYIYNYLMSFVISKESLKEEDIKLVEPFLNEEFQAASQKNIILSILNTVVKDTSMSNHLNLLKTIGNSIDSNVDKILHSSETGILKSELIPFYRNLDNILENSNLVRRRLRVLDEKETSSLNEILIQSQKTLTTLNTFLAKSVVQGEIAEISGMNFQSRVVSPSSKKIPFSIPEEKSLKYTRLSEGTTDIKSYEKNSSPADKISEPCDDKSTSLFCITEKDIMKLNKKLSLESEDDFMSISLLEVDNQALYRVQGIIPISDSSIISDVYSNNIAQNKLRRLTHRSKDQDGNNLVKYQLSYDIQKEANFNEELASNCSCVSFSQLKKPKQSVKCKTYFNYQKNKTICKCQGTGEIVPVFDYALSSLAKLAQFPPMNSKMFNIFNVTFIVSSLLLISVFSLILLILDYRDDKNYKPPNALSEFLLIQSMHNSSILSLAWMGLSYSYPFLSVIYLYNYNQPRFFRFLVQIFSTLVSIIFSSIPFYKSEFSYKEVFIDKRDIQTINYDIHNLPARINDIIASFIYSIIASIICNSIVFIFQILMQYKTIISFYWKERKKLLKSYAKYNYASKHENYTFQIRFILKCIAISTFGEKLLQKRRNSTCKDSLENGFSIRQINENKKGSTQHLVNLKKEETYDDEIYSDDPFSKDDSLLSQKQGSFTLSKYKEKKEKKSISNILALFKPKKKKSSRISKMFGLIRVSSNPKISDVRAEKLVPSYEYNLTFFNTKRNKKQERNDKVENYKMIKLVISVVLLCIFFSMAYFLIFVIFGDLYQRYEFYIIKSWLVPSLINITIFRLIQTYIKTFLYFICIKLLYQHRKKSFLLKIAFRFIIPGYLVSIYKIRDIVNEYYDDFKEDAKKRKEGS